MAVDIYPELRALNTGSRHCWPLDSCQRLLEELNLLEISFFLFLPTGWLKLACERQPGRAGLEDMGSHSFTRDWPGRWCQPDWPPGSPGPAGTRMGSGCGQLWAPTMAVPVPGWFLFFYDEATRTTPQGSHWAMRHRSPDLAHTGRACALPLQPVALVLFLRTDGNV